MGVRIVSLSRPVADISNLGWTLAPPVLPYVPDGIYARLFEWQPDDDTTYVENAASPLGDTFEVLFAGVPLPKAGLDGQLTVRLRSTASGGQVPATVLLLQGGQTLAATSVYPGPGTDYQDVTLPLPASLLAQITDFTDLRLRVTAGGVTVTCSPRPLPLVLHGTITSPCAQINGLSFLLTYQGPSWHCDIFSGPLAGQNFDLTCSTVPSVTWELHAATLACFDFEGTESLPTQVSNDPFQLTFETIVRSILDGCTACVLGQPVTFVITL